jgi:hypothetical protein
LSAAASNGAGGSPQVGQGRKPVRRRPWPRLPWWFWSVVALCVAAFLALGAYAVSRIVGFEPQPLFERRTPPAAGQLSHDVGDLRGSDAPTVPVPCGVIEGLQVQGDDVVRPLLVDALGGLCRRLGALDPRLADRIATAARAGTVISFGVFESTGDASTTVAGSPPRILVNTSYAGAFKGYLLQVLAHELWHAGGTDVTAENEFEARVVEDQICDRVREIASVRGCAEAEEIVELGRDEAVRRLREAGYP